MALVDSGPQKSDKLTADSIRNFEMELVLGLFTSHSEFCYTIISRQECFRKKGKKKHCKLTLSPVIILNTMLLVHKRIKYLTMNNSMMQ